MTRTALAYATVNLAITEYIEPNADDEAHGPITKVDITQTATGGIQSTEKRTTDWRVRGHEDRIFGALSGQSRLVRGTPKGPVLEVQTESNDKEKVARFLKGEILADGSEVEGFVLDPVQDKEGVSYGEGEGLWLQSWVRNEEYGWSAEQVCFFFFSVRFLFVLLLMVYVDLGIRGHRGPALLHSSCRCGQGRSVCACATGLRLPGAG